MGLVLYHRIKNSNFLKDFVSNPILRLIDAYDLIIGDNISEFIKEMLQLILDSIRMLNEDSKPDKELKPDVINP